MYAYQVIDNLKLKVFNCPDILFKETMEYLIKIIPISQKFHIGTYSNLESIIKNLYSKPIFKKELGENIRMPYKISWFDWVFDLPLLPEEKSKHESKKRGCLVVEYGYDLINILFVYYTKELGWMPSIMSNIISVNKRFIDNGNYKKLMGEKKQIENKNSHIHTISTISNIKLSQAQFNKAIEEEKKDLYALNIAIMLLNCNNIITKKIYPPAKLNKKRTKKGKQPLFSYHTLELKLPQKQLAGKSQSEIKNITRIHLCRGHFKTYTKEAPLLGRFAGTYWWQPHIRGNKEKGMVVKDYLVTVDPEEIDDNQCFRSGAG